MKNLKLFASLALVFCMLFSLVGCMSPSLSDLSVAVEDITDSLGEKPTTGQDLTEVPYDEFISKLKNDSAVMGVAYLGYFPNMIDDPSEYKQNCYPEFYQVYSFLANTPESSRVGFCGEIYYIVPADPNAYVKISYLGIDEEGVNNRVLYESNSGEPIMLFCNTGWDPETQVEIIESDGDSLVWVPKLDKNGYTDLSSLADKQSIEDFSPYVEMLLSDYLDMDDDAYYLPKQKHLKNTTWHTENDAPGDANYRISFGKTTANIYWTDESGVEHEYLNAPYEVEVENRISKLTIDLGELGGVREYDILIAYDNFVIYFMVDVSEGYIKLPDEQQYRSFFNAK